MKIKYPRTFHLPSSPGRTSDDKVLRSINHFIGQRVVITEKMDGENTTAYQNGYIHARSLDSANHPSRDAAKKFLSDRIFDLPLGWRVCCENVFARHSLAYNNLESYVYAFSLWDDHNQCLDWDSTVLCLEVLDIPIVPVLWEGVLESANTLQSIVDNIDTETQEGFVMRMKNNFHYDDFAMNVAKWVRANHVQTDKHWRNSEIIPNRLKEV